MESRLKTRISRMFRSSFGSCSTRNYSDVSEKPVFIPLNQTPSSSFKLNDEPTNNNFSPKLRPFPSIFTPTHSLSLTPSFPSPALTEKLKNSHTHKTKTTKKKKKNHTHMKIHPKDTTPFEFSPKDSNFGGNWWYSSDDEADHDDDDNDIDETETLFSSKSSSSDSSRSRRRRRNHHRRRKHVGSEMGVVPLQGKVKDTFAVVKRSSDPYNDFRNSMVEMIVEKQIFAPKDLENLLKCFLSLNSSHHHKIIVEVFTEIYDALFSDWF